MGGQRAELSGWRVGFRGKGAGHRVQRSLTGVHLQAAAGTGQEHAGAVVPDVEVGGRGLGVLAPRAEAHLRDEGAGATAAARHGTEGGVRWEGGVSLGLTGERREKRYGVLGDECIWIGFRVMARVQIAMCGCVQG